MTACIAPTDFNWFNSVIEFVSCASEPVLERPHLTNLFKFPVTNSLSIPGLAFMRLATYESASWRNTAGARTNHGVRVADGACAGLLRLTVAHLLAPELHH